jgi:hypothetical protein
MHTLEKLRLDVFAFICALIFLKLCMYIYIMYGTFIMHRLVVLSTSKKIRKKYNRG